MQFTNPFPSLLGMGSNQPDPYQSLLGEYYDPRQARMAWLGGTLQGLGAGLASGKSGVWAEGLALGGGEGLDNYRQRAVAGYALKQRKDEQDYQKQERDRKAAEEQAQKDAQAAAIAGLPPEMQSMAKAFPNAVIPSYVKNKYFPGGGEAPTSVQEYQYAVQQGFKGSFMDYQASKKGNGITYTDAEGNTIQIGGTSKPLTEGQSKDTVYSTRAEGALPYIDNGETALTSKYDNTVEDIPVVGNYLTSDEYQVASSAGKEFLQALLRKDTGATIQPFEIQEYGSVYLPQPGDKPDRLKYKKEARIRALAAMKAGMPAQAIVAQEKALATPGASGGAAPAPAPSAPAPKVGDIVDSPASIPEGAVVVDESGVAYRMVNGQLQKVQ